MSMHVSAGLRCFEFTYKFCCLYKYTLSIIIVIDVGVGGGVGEAL